MIKIFFAFAFMFILGCSSIDGTSGATKTNNVISSESLDK